jgi:tRNA G18 (ribose-2'-O)-methylase SpoU
VPLREETRRERYDEKEDSAKTYPISLVCVNFKHDGNLGYLIRSAACFGADAIHVIGSIPERKTLNALSGTLYDYIQVIQHATPSGFLTYAKSHQIKLVSAEIHETSIPIADYRFDFSSGVALIVGNEQSGIPTEILHHSDVVNIPMPGVGFCLNTAQTANIILYEAVKRFESHQRFYQQWNDEVPIHLP